MKKNNYLYIRIVVWILLVLIISIKIGCKLYDNHNKYEKLVEQGIYEINNSYHYSKFREKAYSFFMVYEPLENKDELKIWVKDYLINNNYVQKVYDRENLYEEYPIFISFCEPSEEFEYGWQAPISEDLSSNGIGKYEILLVVIPNSKATPEEWIFIAKDEDTSILNTLDK